MGGAGATCAFATIAAALALSTSACSLISLDILSRGDGEGGGGASSSSSSAGGDGGASSPASSSAGPGSGGAGGLGGEGGGAAGGGGEGGGEPVACGKVDMLRDDFELATRTVAYFGLGQTAVQNGELVAAFSPTGSTTQYVSAFSRQTYDLRDSALAVRVLEVTNTTTGYVETFFRLGLDGSYVQFVVSNGQLLFTRRTGNSFQQVGAVTYDPVAHAHWRLREESGTFFFDTSSDGMAWVVRAQTPSSLLLPLDLLQLELGVSSENAGPNPGRARFDDLRGPGQEPGPACKLSTLVDDFSVNSEPLLWRNSFNANGCSRAISGGELRFGFTDGASAYCFHRSSRLYDFTGDAISIRSLERTAPGKTAEAYVELRQPGGDAVIMIGTGTSLMLSRRPAGGSTQQLFSTPYVATDFAYWRLRQEGTNVLLETSPNGTDFVARAQQALEVDWSRVEVIIGAGTWDAPTDVGSVRFDDVNVLP